MKLIICGNGFDVHHELETKYVHYKGFLEENYSVIKESYEQLISANNDTIDAWSDVEKALGLNYLRLFSEFADDPSIRDEVFELSHNGGLKTRVSLLENRIRSLTDFVYDFTGRCYYEWLSNVDYSKASPDLCLSPKDKYITFNYTDTLERFYKIPNNNILYIHGKLDNITFEEELSDLDAELQNKQWDEQRIELACQEHMNLLVREEIQFGATIPDVSKVVNQLSSWYRGDEDYDEYVQSTIQAIVELIEHSTKYPKTNYDKLNSFIATLDDVDEVIIMGHSIDGFDRVYYSDVLVPKYKDRKWIFMTRKKHNGVIDRFVNEMGIVNYEIKTW